MSYTLYRNTTLGNALQDALDELRQMQMLPPSIAPKVLIEFDKSIDRAMSSRVKNKLTFRAGELKTYRLCDNVWTVMLNDVEFKEMNELGKIGRVKVVACEAKS
jgi:transcription initiation factor TFIIA small subunit